MISGVQTFFVLKNLSVLYSARTLSRIAALLWQPNIPLLICETRWLLGRLQIVVRQACVIESHEELVPDLGLEQKHFLRE